ncbi:hypothetical protein [Methylorubrum sp. SB2]|uniref:hypothetical protein n=1 Tax=Methylorubrum subtropicum TaxID=3138812 RepID=UPI00313E342E
MSVIDLDAERDRRQAEAWARYATAREKADRTLAFADGMAAQQAYREFIDLCMTPAQQAFVRGTVTPIGRRA